MVDDQYHLDVNLTSSSTYETHRLLGNAGLAMRNSRNESNAPGNAKMSPINGMRQGMSSALGTRNIPPSTSAPEPNVNLSREELLKLLSVFEGELQARDEVIEILKAEKPNNQTIQDRYGLSNKPLQALRRDAASVDATTTNQVAEQTTQNLQKIIQHQKESYKKLKQALLNAEQANQALAVEINEEKKKHQDYMIKSDDFVNLLEEERERLKIALDKEKEISEQRENEMNRKLKSNKDELAKLKSLSLVLVEERQQQVAELAEHKKQISILDRRTKEAETKCKEAERDVAAEKEHAVQLENDLESQSNKFFQGQEELNMKLQEEMDKNEKLEDKVKTMTQQLKKLKTVQKNLQKTEDQLWRIHEKLEEDEEHDLLLEEVELLRERVKDMEESEKIYTQAQEDCKDIRQKLEEEIKLTRNLRSQLKALKTQVAAQKNLQRSIEDTDFRFDELQLKFEFEKKKSNDMKDQLQKMKNRMTDLDQYEAVVQETEEKMTKMKERIAFLNGEKKCSDDQVQFLIEKNQQLKNESKTENDKVTELTEKFIRESKKVLKLREELSQEKQKCSSQFIATNEKLKQAEEIIKDLSSTKQTHADSANTMLKRQVAMLKSRLDQLETENEAKDAESPTAVKLPKPGPPQPSRHADVGQKLQAAEESCQYLSEQLQMKTKHNEDLRKQLSQAIQVNNSNSNPKTAASKQTVEKPTISSKPSVNKDPAITPKPTARLGINQSSNPERTNLLKQNPTHAKVAPAKVNPGTSTQLLESRTAFLPSPERKKSLISPPPSLARGNKVAPAGFRVAKKPPSAGIGQKPPETSPARTTSPKSDAAALAKGDTIKITKDSRTGEPVIETVKEAEKPKTTQTLPTIKGAENDKGLAVSNQGHKFPKQTSPQRYFRTFQAQKDFSELQKKWASKLAGK